MPRVVCRKFRLCVVRAIVLKVNFLDIFQTHVAQRALDAAHELLVGAQVGDICGAWFGFGSGFGIGFTGTLLLARAPLLLATLLSHTIPFPRVH